MLQRIQSLYLFLAAVVMALLFAFPVFTAEKAAQGPLEDGDYDVYDNMALLILVILVVAMNLITIFLFKNRRLQLNLGKTAMLAVFGVAVLISVFIFTAAESLGVGIGVFSPVIALIFLVLANRGIYKDEKLVQDSNRLR